MEQMINEIKRLYQELYDTHLVISQKESDPYQSVEVAELVTALSKAQSSYPAICSDRSGHKFKYADLDVIVQTIRPSLTQNGLSFTQFTKNDRDGNITLHTRLYHTSGQWIETRALVVSDKAGLGGSSLQAYGSAMTYNRRYQLVALLGITVDKDPTDDNDDPAPSKAQQEYLQNKHVPKPEQVFYEKVTREQEDQLEQALDGYPELAREILLKMDKKSLADIPKHQFSQCLKRIDEIKRDEDKAKRLATAHKQ